MENENRTAERILSGKDSYFMAIKERYGEDVSDRVRTEAAKLLDEYLSTHDPLPRSVAIHVEDNIIPTAYIYGALKGIVGEEALELMKKIKAGLRERSVLPMVGTVLQGDIQRRERFSQHPLFRRRKRCFTGCPEMPLL